MKPRGSTRLLLLAIALLSTLALVANTMCSDAGLLPVVDLPRASIDPDHVRDPRPAMRHKPSGPAEMPASPKMNVQPLR